MKIPDLKKAIEGIGTMGDEGKTLKDKLGEIKDDKSLGEFHGEWKDFLKKNYLSLHPDKNPGRSADFNDFRQKVSLINEYIDTFTENNDGQRKFKDDKNKEDFLKVTNEILNSDAKKDSSSIKSNDQSPSFKKESFSRDDINRNDVFKQDPEPQIKPSWFASVNKKGDIVVVNSNGGKDQKSKALEGSLWYISEDNVEDRFKIISTGGARDVVVVITFQEMNKKINKNNNDKNNLENNQKEAPLLDCIKMIGKYDESLFNAVDVKGIENPVKNSFASKYPSNRDVNSQDNTLKNTSGKGRF